MSEELIDLPAPEMSEEWDEWAQALIAQLQPNLFQFDSTALVPAGTIVGWNGTADTIPPGWEEYTSEVATTFIYMVKL